MAKKPRETPKKEKFLKTGIAGFDKLFEHGIPNGKAILLEGSPGTGHLCRSAGYRLYVLFP